MFPNKSLNNTSDPIIGFGVTKVVLKLHPDWKICLTNVDRVSEPSKMQFGMRVMMEISED
jgi:hypothetical protein